MPHYLVTFIGHVNDRIMPDNFPAIPVFGDKDEDGTPLVSEFVIKQVNFLEAHNKKEIVDYINNESFKFIRMQGMSVRIDPSAIEDPAELDTQRMFVPMSMLTYISAEVKPIMGNFEEIDNILASTDELKRLN